MKKDALIFLLSILSTTIFSQTNLTAITAQDTICQGASVALSADGDVFEMYQWSPSDWINNVNIPNPIVTPPTTTTYTVVGSILGNNIISNGDFSAGNSDFITAYSYGPQTNGGPWGALSEEGTYHVVPNPNDAHSNFANCDDHTTGFGNMMVVNGVEIPNQAVWCQEVNVDQNTTYEFSTWITSVELGNPAELQFSINEVLLGSAFNAPSSTCDWLQFFETWESGNTTSAEICIVNQNISVGGNDFALDDISFSPILIDSSSVTVYVSDISGVIAAQSTPDCNGNLGTASIAVNGGFPPYTYLWDNGETTEVATNLEEGNHAVTVTDAVGCAAIVNLAIEPAQLPVIDEVVVEQTTCGFANGWLEIFPGAGAPPFLYSINGVDFQAEPNFTDVAAGTFFAVIEDANGCTNAMEVTVNSSEVISTTIATPDGVDFCESVSITLDAGTFETYLWSNGETSPTIDVEDGGNYAVTVSDMDGCEAMATVDLEDCGEWSMPNTFTPDGDGVNDTFGPVIEGNAVEIIEFKIFNRWGNLVHQEKTPWDGTYDGDPHPSDVLVFIIQVETRDGVEVLNGDVTLIR